jgi:hypothetical protein
MFDSYFWFDDVEVFGGIPREIKKIVYERDNFTCQVSGLKDNLSIHHIVRAVDRGPAEPHNLILVNRKYHDYLHLSKIPTELYVEKMMYNLSRMNILRDVILVKHFPSNFNNAYGYVRAMFDAVNKNDPWFGGKNLLLNFNDEYGAIVL